MADYQSLLTRAVANLPPSSSAASRQAIYDRARKALVTQLRSLRPPLPEGDIAREEAALDKAIASVEASFTGAPPGADASPHAAAPQPAAPPKSAAPSYKAPPAPQPTAAAHTAPSPSSPATSSSRAAPPPAPSTRPFEARPSTARPPARGGPPSVAPRPAPPSRSDAGPLKPPPVEPQHRTADATAAPAVIRTEADGEAPASANLSAVVPGAETRPVEASASPPVVASRDEEGENFASAPEAPLDEDRIATGRPEGESLRPVAPFAPSEKGRWAWPWAALAVVVGIVLSVAAVAILMRQAPQDLAIKPPAPAQEALETPAKIAQRAQSSPAEGTAPAPAPAPNPGQQQAPSEGSAPAGAAPDAKAEAQLPAAARAAMLIASQDNTQKPIVNLGSTVWSTIPAPAGQPAGVAIEADADIPDLKMHASMILRKSTDPTLPATHTIDLKFTFQDGAPFNGFKDAGLPQMRKANTAGSEALNGAKEKISDAYFLFALAKGDQDATRNLDLMQTRAWFEFPLLLNDNRITKLIFEKSADGEAMLEKAFDAWK
ncbi:MAG TPA: hypothetical protein VEH77_09925 [Roseiarcus sp.]|nr:hypothetical protein [Roseiarcus sp.]